MQEQTKFEVLRHNSYQSESLKDQNFTILSDHESQLKAILNNKSYDIIVKKFDLETKQAIINVSGSEFSVQFQEPLDQLISELGFLKAIKHSVKEIKSPMPGLVVNVFVELGQTVSEGEKLLSLEAMKMENILKSPGEGIIKSISVSKGNSVEKNQILIEFE